MLAKLKQHKMAFWLMALLAACGIAIAASELAGQSNKTCADAGISGADMELASLDTIKQSESNPVDWMKERDLRKKIDVINDKYMALAKKAAAEAEAAGKVTDNTRSAGLACAQDYKAANETYAQFWEQNNGKTRARLAREAGEARIKNADMTFNEIDSDKVDAYNDQMKVLAEARQDYLEEAKTDVSAEDRAAIKSDLMPRVQGLATNFMTLLDRIKNLLSEVKTQFTSGGLGGLASCSSNALQSDNPAAQLLSPLTSLMSLVQSMASDAKSLSDDLSSL